jgi:excinuclease UvrABC ATPase subunit
VKHFGVDELLPYADLPDAFKTALIHGTGETPIQMSFGANGKAEKAAKPFEGLIRRCNGSTKRRKSVHANRIRSL